MAGRVYTHRGLVSGAAVGPSGGAHLHAIADWLQEAAFADGIDAGLGTESAWIIRRTSLRIERLPRFGEELTLRTWCGGLAASVAERRTTIEGDGGAAIESEAIWVHVDPVARRPARFTREFLAVYNESACDRRPRTKLRHPATPTDSAFRLGWTFGPTDLDIAGHVNNAVYWRIAEQFLDAASLPQVEIEYRNGVGAGPAELLIEDGGQLAWVVAPNGEVAATIGTQVR